MGRPARDLSVGGCAEEDDVRRHSQGESLLPRIAIRELLANALINHDMTMTGTGPTVELFRNRMEIVKPGASLVEPARFIDSPPRSRNEALASLMRRMGLYEEQGMGIDKTIEAVEQAQLPPSRSSGQRPAPRARPSSACAALPT